MQYTKSILEDAGKYDAYSLRTQINLPIINRCIDLDIERSGENYDQEIDDHAVRCVNTIPDTSPDDLGEIESALLSHYLLIRRMSSLSDDGVPTTIEYALGTVSRYGGRPEPGYSFDHIIIPSSCIYQSLVWCIFTKIWWDCEHGVCCVFIDGKFKGLADLQRSPASVDLLETCRSSDLPDFITEGSVHEPMPGHDRAFEIIRQLR